MSPRLLLTPLLFLCFVASAQQSCLVHRLDSMRRADIPAQNSMAPTGDIPSMTISDYFGLLGSDVLQELSAPFHGTGRGYIYAAGFAVAEAGLFFIDEPLQHSAATFAGSHPAVRDAARITGNVGGVYSAGLVAAFGAYGLFFKDNRALTTALLTSQAYIISGGITKGVKYLSGRQRPNYYDTYGYLPADNTVFTGPQLLNGNDARGGFSSSFPSLHTSAAFSAATVFAGMYADEPAVPVIAYAIAGLVGISRIAENEHWLTDVVAGGALGYVTGRQVLRNYRRYARLRAGSRKATWSFGLQYRDGIIMPGALCRF